jgi:hypothetical protein
VNNFEVEDRLNPGETIESKGHLFLPIPCLDPTSGDPVADRTCEYTTTARYWGSCATSGCHADAAQVELAFSSQRSNIATLADLIWVDTDADEVLFESDSNGAFIAFDPGDTGLLTQVPSPEINFNAADDSISVAEGALFNMQLIAEGRDDHGDGSKGVHNPFLSVDLLTASLNSLQDAYTLSAPLSPEARALVDRINRRLLRTRAPHTISTR